MLAFPLSKGDDTKVKWNLPLGFPFLPGFGFNTCYYRGVEDRCLCSHLPLTLLLSINCPVSSHLVKRKRTREGRGGDRWASLSFFALGSSWANEDKYKVEEGKVKTGKASSVFSPCAKQDHTG